MPTEDEIMKALEDVIDPELGLNITELGLIYKLEIRDGGGVLIDMTMTSPGCPVAEQIIMETEVKVRSLGVKEVSINLVFSPPWTPEMMSMEARMKTGFM